MPQKILECEEYEQLKIGAGVQELSSTHLARIESTWKALTGKLPTSFFDYGANTVRPKNWTGVIFAPGITLQVLPKGAKTLADPEKALLDHNISLMTRLALDTTATPLSSASLSAVGSRFEQSVDALCDLILAARRQEVLRQYHVRRETIRASRGRLIFPQQALSEIQRPGQFLAQWVELHEDIPENRFLKAALDYCHRKLSGSLRHRVDIVLAEFDAVQTVSLPQAEYQKIRLDRLNANYHQAILLAQQLLGGSAGGFFVGSLHSRSEVLFMPQMFEAFVTRLAQEFALQKAWDWNSKRRGRYLGTWYSGPYQGNKSFEIIPDIELKEKGASQSIVLIDAKWKWLRPSAPHFGVGGDDIYQMVAYSTHLSCTHLLLVYPWMGYKAPFPNESPILTLGSKDVPIKLSILCLPLLWSSIDEVKSQLFSTIEILLAS